MFGSELVSLTLNGDRHVLAARSNETLLDLVRDGLGLTGTKRGCDDGSCGACTVLLDGVPNLACCRLAWTVEGAEVVTIEATERDERTLRLQQALAERGGLQCGFCTPGIVLAAWAHLERGGGADARSIREGISGNICRCTGYQGIVEALECVARAEPGGQVG